jgi:hypothetical protein
VVKVAAAEATSAKGAATKLVVIELDNSDDKGDDKGNDKNAYATFKAITVKDKVIKEAV